MRFPIHTRSVDQGELLDDFSYTFSRSRPNILFCRISDVNASTMWPSCGRVLPRGGPRPSDLQRAPAYPVTPDRPKVSLEVMNIDGMTLCEREPRGERAQSRAMRGDGRMADSPGVRTELVDLCVGRSLADARSVADESELIPSCL